MEQNQMNLEEQLFIQQLQTSPTIQLAKDVENHTAFYYYPQAKEIIQTIIYPRFTRADCNSNDRGLIYFFYGDYHTGKSHLLRYSAYFMKKMHPVMWERFEAPIVKIDLNNHINTAQQLLLLLLEKLGRPIDLRVVNSWKKTNIAIERLRTRLIKLLEELGTRVLILDECQKLLISRNPDITDIFELLKDLSTKHNWNGKLRTEIILCGTKDGIPLLEAANWIQGRTMTTKLCELKIKDYAKLLLSIYKDFVKIGISENWELVNYEADLKKHILNRKVAQYLFTRTNGKVGLTVDLIRKSIIFALDQGRFFPKMKDYESIKLTDKSSMFTISSMKKNQNKKPVEKKKVKIALHNRSCVVNGCPKSKTPYARYKPLIDHYKNNHPDIELVFDEDL
jgi:Bacterial TniB protein